MARWHATPAMARLCRGRLREPLDSRGFALVDGIITAEAAASVRTDLRRIFSEHGCAPDTLTHERRMRSDRVNATNEHEAATLGGPALAAAVRTLKALGAELVAALDGSCGRLSLPPNVQSACYGPSGAYYRRHTDNMPAHPERVTHVPSNLREQLMTLGELRNWRAFTVILYVNEGWQAEHGGCLRLHHEEGGLTDVEPIAGRCVFFNSLMQHEVMPAWQRERWALTLWVWREDGDESKAGVS